MSWNSDAATRLAVDVVLESRNFQFVSIGNKNMADVGGVRQGELSYES